MTFFGEEKVDWFEILWRPSHFPIEKTVAGINIEQVGRTDDSEGAQVASVGVTGFDFSSRRDHQSCWCKDWHQCLEASSQ